MENAKIFDRPVTLGRRSEELSIEDRILKIGRPSNVRREKQEQGCKGRSPEGLGKGKWVNPGPAI